MTALSLHQRIIAIPETRELDVFAALLERRGAQVIRCPLVGIRTVTDPAPVLAWVQAFVAGACDDLILYTGEGLVRLHDLISQHAATIWPSFLAKLATTRRFCRGPKPQRVLREWGLDEGLQPAQATTAGMIELLSSMSLAGRRVGLQLYGSEPNHLLQDYLRQAGASVLPVAPYAYVDEAEDEAVLALIEQLQTGVIDAIAFTSMQQLRRLQAVARTHASEDALRQGLNHCVVAAVGPVVAARLQAMGISAIVMPVDRFYLKPLSQALAQHLQASELSHPNLIAP